MSPLRRGSRTAATLLFAAGSLAAQAPRPLSLGGGVDVSYRVRSRGPDGVAIMRGIGATGVGQVAVGRLRLRASYGESFFEAGRPDQPSVELVEAEAFLGYAPRNWLSVWAGPHVRTYTVPAGDTRWLLWEARASARTPLVSKWLDVFFEGWVVVAGSGLSHESFGGGRGARGGIAFRLFDPGVWVNLSHRVEHLRFDHGARRESIEVLTLRLEGRP